MCLSSHLDETAAKTTMFQASVLWMRKEKSQPETQFLIVPDEPKYSKRSLCSVMQSNSYLSLDGGLSHTHLFLGFWVGP